MFQIQVNYREKVRQFYINEILTDYSQLIESIVTNINSLFGCVFQVQYLNDEDSWITLGENREDVRDMFRCSRIVENAEFKRVKIKIVEGCSPAIEHGKKRSSDESDASLTPSSDSEKRPRRLSFGLTAYRSPIDIDIEQKESEISYMESEVSCLDEQYEKLMEMYSIGVVKRQGKQCGKCHLFQNHRKNNCPNDLCVSAQMCGDINKHQEETQELRDIDLKKQKLRAEIKREKQELDLKQKCAEKINSSFSKRMEQELINSNREKYLIQTQFGIKPRQALLNEHIGILERHYKGKMPHNIQSERPFFEKIINSAISKIPERREPNAMRRMLTGNATYPVQFPNPRKSTKAAPTATVTSETPPLPLGPPPPQPPLPSSPMTQSDLVNYGYSWMPWSFPCGTYNFGTSGDNSTPSDRSAGVAEDHNVMKE